MRILKKLIFKPEVDRQNCLFCKIIQKREEHFHYEDEDYVVISDINHASSIEHLLVITKIHIDDALKVQDPAIIETMHKIGEKVLNDICQKRGLQKQFRFGFHLPPINSIDHIHLHCFIEPLSAWKYNTLLYGWLLNTVDQTLEKLSKINSDR